VVIAKKKRLEMPLRDRTKTRIDKFALPCVTVNVHRKTGISKRMPPPCPMEKKAKIIQLTATKPRTDKNNLKYKRAGILPKTRVEKIMQSKIKAGRMGEFVRRPAIKAKMTKNTLRVVFLYLSGLRRAMSSIFLIIDHFRLWCL